MASGFALHKKRTWLWIAPSIGLILALSYSGLILLAPEASKNHVRGPAVLNGSGAGYQCGDVVWLRSPRDPCDPNAAALYDWRAIEPRGFGPELAIAAFGTLSARQREHVVAVVWFKLGHDRFRARYYRNVVY
jgi:hypothetical protein